MKFRKTKEKIVNIAITTEVSTLLYDADSGDTLRPTEPCNDCLLKPLNNADSSEQVFRFIRITYKNC